MALHNKHGSNVQSYHLGCMHSPGQNKRLLNYLQTQSPNPINARHMFNPHRSHYTSSSFITPAHRRMISILTQAIKDDTFNRF
jgi:hypothetical protein